VVKDAIAEAADAVEALGNFPPGTLPSGSVWEHFREETGPKNSFVLTFEEADPKAKT
jgi:hypothetical protein